MLDQGSSYSPSDVASQRPTISKIVSLRRVQGIHVGFFRHRLSVTVQAFDLPVYVPSGFFAGSWQSLRVSSLVGLPQSLFDWQLSCVLIPLDPCTDPAPFGFAAIDFINLNQWYVVIPPIDHRLFISREPVGAVHKYDNPLH